MVLDQLVSWLNFLSISLVYYFSLLTLVDSLFKDMLFLLIWFVFMLQSQTLPLDNVCAMLRMLIALDSEETRISEQAFVSLVEILPRYLIDIVHVSFLFFIKCTLPAHKRNKICSFVLKLGLRRLNGCKYYWFSYICFLIKCYICITLPWKQACTHRWLVTSKKNLLMVSFFSLLCSSFLQIQARVNNWI